MVCILFPKFFQPLPAGELAQRIHALGFDGVDILVRDDYWVTTETIRKDLPEFVRIMHDFGLSTTSATTDLLDVEDPRLESSLAAMADQGVRQFRLRHLPYRGLGTLHKDVDAARRTLLRLEGLCEKHGLRCFVQTHGGTLHPSASATYSLVQGLDPSYVGVHFDPANMIYQDGHEAWQLGVDLLGPYICMVGVKNAGVYRDDSDVRRGPAWRREWTTLESGLVDWCEVLGLLRAAGYGGPLCMHNFYEMDLASLTEQTRRDLEHLRALLGMQSSGE